MAGPLLLRRALAAMALVTGVGLLAAGSAGAAAERPRVRRVLILSLPGTTWAALDEAEVPHLDAFLAGAALGSTSVRAIEKTTRPGDGYVTIGAGTAAAGVARVEGLAFDVGEPRHVVSVGRPALAQDARHRHRGAEVGAFGEALARAGVNRGVVGNADVALRLGDDPDADYEVGPHDDAAYHREVAQGLADHAGVVPFGSVGRSLLREDPTAPFGIRLDPDRAVGAFRSAWDRPGRTVVLFEASDLARLHTLHKGVPPGRRPDPDLARRTFEATDELIGRILADVDLRRDAVVVTAPSDPGDGVHLTVAGLRAPGVPTGLLDSATTRRAGYVTLPDLGPTVLDLLGVARPDSMEGRPYEIHPRSWSVPPVARFVEADREARFRDRMLGPVTGAYVTIEILLGLAVAFVLVRHPGWRRLRRAFNLVGLWLLAVVPLTFLGSVLDITAVAPYLLLVMGGGAVLAAGAAALRGPIRPLAALLGLLLAVHIGDVMTGAHLQMATVFGYSPTVGGRFAGFGNLAFGQVAAGAILLAGILAHRFGPQRGLRAAVAVLAVTLLAIGMPFWGADVGGVLAAVPAFMLVALGLSGRSVSPGRLAALAAGGVAAVGALGLLDLLRPAERRTHLGRLFEQMGEDGLRPLTDAIQRKIASNLSVIPTSIWIPLVPAVLAFYTWLAYGSSFRLAEIKRRAPAMRPAFVGLLVAAVLGFALNDSGIAVPAMMLGVLNPVLVRLALHTDGLSASTAGAAGEAPRPEPQRRAVDEPGTELRVGEPGLP